MAACQLASSHRLCTQSFIDAVAVQPDFIQARRPNPRFVAACASSALALRREARERPEVGKLEPGTLRGLACKWLAATVDDQVRRPPLTESGRVWLSGELHGSLC